MPLSWRYWKIKIEQTSHYITWNGLAVHTYVCSCMYMLMYSVGSHIVTDSLLDYLDCWQHLVEVELCHWLRKFSFVHNTVKELTSLHAVSEREWHTSSRVMWLLIHDTWDSQVHWHTRSLNQPPPPHSPTLPNAPCHINISGYWIPLDHPQQLSQKEYTVLYIKHACTCVHLRLCVNYC